MANFIRKNPDSSGVYYGAFRSNEDGTLDEIKIEGRSIYSTDDKKRIEFLRKDQEIVEVDKGTQIEATDEV